MSTKRRKSTIVTRIFVAGESGVDEYIEREEYPLCQPAYDSEDLSYSEGTQ